MRRSSHESLYSSNNKLAKFHNNNVNNNNINNQSGHHNRNNIEGFNSTTQAHKTHGHERQQTGHNNNNSNAHTSGWSSTDAGSEKSCMRKESCDSNDGSRKHLESRRDSYDSTDGGGGGGGGGRIGMTKKFRSGSCDSEGRPYMHQSSSNNNSSSSGNAGNITKTFRSNGSFDSTDDNNNNIFIARNDNNISNNHFSHEYINGLRKVARSSSCEDGMKILNGERSESQENEPTNKLRGFRDKNDRRKNSSSFRSGSFDSVEDGVGTKNEHQQLQQKQSVRRSSCDSAEGGRDQPLHHHHTNSHHKTIQRKESFDAEEDNREASESRRRLAHRCAGSSSNNTCSGGGNSGSGGCAVARSGRESRHLQGGFGRVAQASHFAGKGTEGFVDSRAHQTSVNLLRKLENPEVHPGAPIPPKALRDCYERENYVYQDQLSSQMRMMLRDKERERQLHLPSNKPDFSRSAPRSHTRRRSKDINGNNNSRPHESPFRVFPSYLSDDDQEKGPRLGSPEFCPLPPLSPIDNFRCLPQAPAVLPTVSATSLFPLPCSPASSSASTVPICSSASSSSASTPRVSSPSSIAPRAPSPFSPSPTNDISSSVAACASAVCCVPVTTASTAAAVVVLPSSASSQLPSADANASQALPSAVLSNVHAAITPVSSFSPRSLPTSNSASSLSLTSPLSYLCASLPPAYTSLSSCSSSTALSMITTLSQSARVASPLPVSRTVTRSPVVAAAAAAASAGSSLTFTTPSSLDPLASVLTSGPNLSSPVLIATSTNSTPEALRVHLASLSITPEKYEQQSCLSSQTVSELLFSQSVLHSASTCAASSSASVSLSSPILAAVISSSASISLPDDCQLVPSTPKKAPSQVVTSPSRVLDFLLASHPPNPPSPPTAPIAIIVPPSPPLTPLLTPVCSPHLHPPNIPALASPPSSPDFSISRQQDDTVRLSPPQSPSFMTAEAASYSHFAERYSGSSSQPGAGRGGGGTGDRARAGVNGSSNSSCNNSSGNQRRVPSRGGGGSSGGRGSGGRNAYMDWKGASRPPLWVPFRVPQQKMFDNQKPPKYPSPPNNNSNNHSNNLHTWQNVSTTSVSTSRLMSSELIDVHSSEILEEDLADRSSMCSLDSDEDYIMAQKLNDMGALYKPGSSFQGLTPLDMWRENFRQKRAEFSPNRRETSRSSLSSEGSSLSTSSLASTGYRNRSLSSLDSWQTNFERSRQNHYVPNEVVDKEPAQTPDNFPSGQLQPPSKGGVPPSRGLMPSGTSVIYYYNDRHSALVGGNAQHVILCYAPRSRNLPPGPGSLHWYPPGGGLGGSQFIALSDIVDVYVGKKTEVMGLPVANKAVSKRCFSIVSKDGSSVNFETGAACVRAAWVYGIHCVLTAFGQRTTSLDDDPAPPATVGPSPNSSVSTCSTFSTSEFATRPSLVHVSPPSTLSNPSCSPSRSAWQSSPETLSPLPSDCFVLQVFPFQPEPPTSPPSPLGSSPSPGFNSPSTTPSCLSTSHITSLPLAPSQSSPSELGALAFVNTNKVLSPQRVSDLSLSRPKAPTMQNNQFLARPKSPGLTKPPLSLSLDKCPTTTANSSTSPRATSPRAGAVGPSAFQFYSPASTMTPLGTPSLRMHPRGRSVGNVRIERARPRTTAEPAKPSSHVPAVTPV